MPQDAESAAEKDPAASRVKTPSKYGYTQWFATPQPIKLLFDRFPLITYPPNELPLRTARHREKHALYIFTTDEGAKRGAPSFNPGCLKWQVRLLKP